MPSLPDVVRALVLAVSAPLEDTINAFNPAKKPAFTHEIFAINIS
jgi:hypothetical protein